jgi:hypothetical protein
MCVCVCEGKKDDDDEMLFFFPFAYIPRYIYIHNTLHACFPEKRKREENVGEFSIQPAIDFMINFCEN